MAASFRFPLVLMKSLKLISYGGHEMFGYEEHHH